MPGLAISRCLEVMYHCLVLFTCQVATIEIRSFQEMLSNKEEVDKLSLCLTMKDDEDER